MSAPNDTPAPNTKSVLVGAGTGTGLVGLAGIIPAEYEPWKTILVYFAPSISVGVSVSWLVASGIISRWFASRQVNIALKEARAHCDEICRNPQASTEHTANARGMVERLEALKFTIIERRVSALDVKLTS